MSPVVDLILVLVLMPAAGYAVIVGWRGANWLAEKRCKPPAPEPIDRLTAKHHRVRALRGAYIDTLTAACERLDVPPPPGDRAPLAEIYRVEAALRQRGLDVREPAAR